MADEVPVNQNSEIPVTELSETAVTSTPQIAEQAPDPEVVQAIGNIEENLESDPHKSLEELADPEESDDTNTQETVDETEKDRTTSPEKELCTVNNLYLAIHPLYENNSPGVIPDRIAKQSEGLFNQMIITGVPQTDHDVFLMMVPQPDQSGALKELINSKASKKLYPFLRQWHEIYKEIIHRAGADKRKNVIMSPDIVLGWDYSNPNPDMLFQFLEKKGFSITEETIITLGGQTLQYCLQAAINHLLSSEKITHLRIDKKATVDKAYSEDKPYTVDKFIAMNKWRYTVVEDNDYIYLEKPAIETVDILSNT